MPQMGDMPSITIPASPFPCMKRFIAGVGRMTSMAMRHRAHRIAEMTLSVIAEYLFDALARHRRRTAAFAAV